MSDTTTPAAPGGPGKRGKDKGARGNKEERGKNKQKGKRDKGTGEGQGPFGRFVGDGDLRLIVLTLLADGPRHGYDVIKALEERSSGFYSPSPGVIYPTLTYLEEAGHAVSSAEGNKNVYEITATGRAFMQENEKTIDAILARVKSVGDRRAQAHNALEGKEKVRRRDRDMPGAVPELNEARRSLKTALASKAGAPEDEQRRIAELLRRLASDITGGAAPGEPDSVDL